MLNYLQAILLFTQLLKTKEESASYLTNDLDTILNGHITGILHSIQTPKNLRTSFCSLEKT